MQETSRQTSTLIVGYMLIIMRPPASGGEIIASILVDSIGKHSSLSLSLCLWGHEGSTGDRSREEKMHEGLEREIERELITSRCIHFSVNLVTMWHDQLICLHARHALWQRRGQNSLSTTFLRSPLFSSDACLFNRRKELALLLWNDAEQANFSARRYQREEAKIGYISSSLSFRNTQQIECTSMSISVS